MPCLTKLAPILITSVVASACSPAQRGSDTDAGPDGERPSVCGDSYVNSDAGEQCDDGNSDSGDGCDSRCQFEIPDGCGDGVANAPEECDDANNEAGDGCGPGCWIEGCGNAFIDPGEACEDGNNVDGDGCSANCKSDETCGNGIVDPAESCDDGNDNDSDVCPATCQPSTCGDGFVQVGVESCDDGNAIADDGCTSCILDSCGNGKLDEGEECDLGAGNGMAGSDCFRTCIATTIAPSTQEDFDPNPFSDYYSFQAGFAEAADINLDGRPDVLVTIPGFVTAQVLMGLGDGQLAPMVRSPSPSGSFTGVTSGDVNSDGKLDVLAVSNGNVLTVLLGNGQHFIERNEFDTVVDLGGNNPSDLILADLTGDGIKDVGIASATSGDVVIMVGDGTGSFAATTRLPTSSGDGGASPAALASGDVTGDGVVDIVTANSGSDDVTLFAGLGGGQYSSGQLFTARVGAGGEEPRDIVITDVTNDGVRDVIIVASRSDDVIVLAASGGSLASPKRFTTRSGDSGVRPGALSIADLNKDGIKDIVTANLTSGDLSVLLGLGPGVAFGAPSHLSVQLPDFGEQPIPRQVAIRDIDGDNIVDLVVTTERNGAVVSLLGLGAGDFAEPKEFSANTFRDTDGAFTLNVADFNDDDKLDAIVTSFSNLRVIHGTGDGRFVPAAELENVRSRNVGHGDFDGDGFIDFIYASSGERLSDIYQQPNGDFTRRRTKFISEVVTHLTVANLDGDEASEAVFIGTGFYGVIDFEPGSQSVPSPTFSNVASAEGCELADVTGDDAADLILTSSQSDAVHIGVGNGAATFGSPTPISVRAGTSGVNPDRSRTADLNGDDISDIVTANQGSNDLSVLIGEGNGTFRDPVFVSTTFGAASAGETDFAIGDFNGDGILDLAATNGDLDTVGVMLGLGDGAFAAPQVFDVPEAPRGIAALDLDNDGRDDLVVVTQAAQLVTILRGLTHP